MTQWTAAGAFSKDAGTDFEARCTLGKAGYGIGDIGPALATLDRIGDDGPQAWFDQWLSTAQSLADRADAAAGRVRAGSCTTCWPGRRTSSSSPRSRAPTGTASRCAGI